MLALVLEARCSLPGAECGLRVEGERSMKDRTLTRIDRFAVRVPTKT
jgi:hypothetical protein